MASTVLPDISLDHKAGPRISPPFKDLPPLNNPLQTKAATSLISGTFQFVDGNSWASVPLFQDLSSYAFDGFSKRLFLLRRSDPVVAVLDASGNVIHERTAAQTGIKNGTVIKCRYTNNDSESMTLWVADSGNSSIRPFDVNGHPLNSFAPVVVPVKEGFGKFTDIAWDSSGKFYVTDSAQGDAGGKRIVVLDASGTQLRTWGAENNAINEARFKDPVAITVDPISRVWLVDGQEDGQDPHVRVLSETGSALADFDIPLPGFSIIETRFSRVRCRENTGILYITARRKVGLMQFSGFLFLIEVRMNPKIPGDIGLPILPPLTACLIPNASFYKLTLEESGPEPGYFYLMSYQSTGIQTYHLGEQRPLRNPITRPAPLWPEVFSATLILHPFKVYEYLAVAKLLYNFHLGIMLFDIYTEGGHNHTIAYCRDEEGSTKVYIRSKRLPWFEAAAANWAFPAPDWLQAAGADLQGNLPLRNVPVNWWHQEFGKQQEANWHWFRSDTNPSLPFRTMNMNAANPNKLPLLGHYAFIYWPYVTPSSHPNGVPELEKALAEIKNLNPELNKQIDASYVPSLLNDLRKLEGDLDLSDKKENLHSVSNLIPGFEFGDGGLELPVFPEQFFMSSTMTPINRPAPLSTEITYDWPTKSQRTRMFDGLEGPVIDCQLFNQTAHIFMRYENGDYQKIADIPGLGPPRPDWATIGRGEIIATITDNPVLSPGTVTRIFHAPVNPPYQFWIWYSTHDTPVMFMQTAPTVDEGTSLALADYKIMQPTTLIDPHTFDVPYPY